SAEMMPAVVARPMTMKANSPPGPKSSAVSIVDGQEMPKKRSKATSTPPLTISRPRMPPISQNGGWIPVPTSRLMPTEKQKPPSSSPLSGPRVASMARDYGVSDSSRPETKAPKAIDSPADAVTRPLPTTTNNAAATNSSVESAEATRRNSGRSSAVPSTAINP